MNSLVRWQARAGVIGMVLKTHVDKSFVGGIVGGGGRLVRWDRFILVALFVVDGTSIESSEKDEKI